MILARRQTAKSATLPAPFGGWDAQNALPDMPKENAVILDNWFPDTDKVTLRKGYTSHATGMTGAVDTLIEYTGTNGTNKLFAANNGKIYDVSSSGAVGAAVVSSLTNNRWQQVQIGTAGGQFAFICNGADTPRTYNGTTWANSTITGPTIANLIWCNLHQNRLWVGEGDSLDAWYGGVNAINGTFKKFSLAGVCKRGGYIMAMGTWTRDSGAGQDDVAVFLTSEGEAAVYSGSIPSNVNTWGLVGVFRIGRPIGRRCMIKAGSDLVMITEDGFVSAETILTKDRSQAESYAISRQINNAVNTAVNNYASLFGWEAFIYPKGEMAIFNVPQTTTTSHQYVFNTNTGAPCRFTGINALCWALKGDTPFFGGSDGVAYKFDFGNDDNGAKILGDALPAFHYFGSPGVDKSFRMVEPVFQSVGDPSAALDLNVDFNIRIPQGVTAQVPISAAKWGVAKWGVGKWGTSDQIYRGWRGVRGKGRAASLRVRVSTAEAQVSWIATHYTYIPGGMI